MTKSRALLLLSLSSLLIALFLRVYLWGSAPASFDELIQFDLLWRNSSLWGSLHYNLVHDYQFPLHYILTYPLVKWGDKSLLIMRLISLLSSLGSLVLFFKLCQLRFKGLHLYFSLALYSLSLPIIYFSFIARPYSLLVFFSTLALYLWEKRSTGAPFFLCLFLLSSTHLFGLFMGMIFLLSLLKNKLSTQNLKKVLMAMAFCFCSLLAIYFFSVAELEEISKRSLNWRKFLGLFSYIGSGYGAYLVFSYFVFNDFFFKKNFSPHGQFLSMSSALIALAVALNFLGLPSFEYRFFVGLIPLLIFSLVSLLYEIRSFRKVYFSVLGLLLIQALAMPLISGKKLFYKAPRVDLLIKENRELISSQEKIVACGNCPRIYFENDRQLSCLQGWDFSQNREVLEGMTSLMVFDDNRVFCQKYIHAHFTTILRYPGVTYFSK